MTEQEKKEKVKKIVDIEEKMSENESEFVEFVKEERSPELILHAVYTAHVKNRVLKIEQEKLIAKAFPEAAKKRIYNQVVNEQIKAGGK